MADENNKALVTSQEKNKPNTKKSKLLKKLHSTNVCHISSTLNGFQLTSMYKADDTKRKRNVHSSACPLWES